MVLDRVVQTVGIEDVGARQLLGYVPITVATVWVIAWFLASNDIRYEEVFGYGIEVYNPAEYTLTMLFHLDWQHFTGNMELWLPAGIVLTLLTSNRHVLLIIVVSHGLAQIVGVATGQVGVGFSSAALAANAAALVRAVGITFQNSSEDLLVTVVASVLLLANLLFFSIAVLSGPNQTIAHFHHFFGFLFGGAIESMYVFDAYGDDGSEERTTPKQVGL